MRRFLQLSLASWFAISMTLAQVSLAAAQTAPTSSASTDEYSRDAGGTSSSHFDTSGYASSPSESQALTEYLKQRKLPLVGAQVLRNAAGRRMVVLYGFVGSDFGKADAAKKTRLFLHSDSVEVDNRINVRPELLASNRPSSADTSNPGAGYAPPGPPANSETSSAPDGSSAYPGPDSYKAQQANPYAQQLGSMMPLIALLGALGMTVAGGNSGFSFGTSPFSSRYGNPYASPYGPYGSPYSSPFGASPYSAYPYGRAPYGSSPFGSSPYGTPPFASSP